MIPHTLSLVNFLCYRQANLDLTGVHLACLAGDNGAGKSALLDAITWALWGKSRARRDDELIHLGADEMAVELVFELGGRQYRVLRRRSAAKRSTSMLDLQVRGDERWRSLTEGGIRDTQEKIERILRLDYDTFVNSAFLRQGRADEFTVKTAAERKRVLGDILGLDRWTAYEGQAKGRLRSVRAEADLTDLRLAEIDQELGRRPQYARELKAAQGAVAELGAALAAAQAACQRVEAARAELRHAESQIIELTRRIEQVEQELKSTLEDQAERRRRMVELKTLLAQADEIEAGYAGYLEAVELERALGAKLGQSVELSSRRSALEQRLAEAQRQIETDRDLALGRVSDLENQVPSDGLLSAHNSAEARLLHLRELANSREAARADLASIAEQRAALKARNAALRAEMASINEKAVLLDQAQAECPLCGQALAEDHRVRILSQFQAEGAEQGELYRANLRSMDALAERALDIEQQIAEGDRLLSELPAVQRKEAALSERIARGEQAAGRLIGLRVHLADIQRHLTEQDFALEVRAQAEKVLREAAKLGYDVRAHESARDAVEAGREFAEKRAQLATAQAQLAEEKETVKRLDEVGRRWRERLKGDTARWRGLEGQVEELQVRLGQAPALENELQRVRGEEAAARQRLGASLQRLEACNSLEKQRAERLKRRDDLGLRAAIYDELRTAFGVRGVPAMIIEAAVPEIEAEANRLLARMTDGRMHVRIDTQRETLAGEVREALEIQISDELGTRPYESYSGGEQFRINFAIRIALSRLLARRSGAQLQTLVIDEGFGTQDAQGRQRLVAAINAIGDEFARVLVVTHIEELKDAFPVRIEVSKTAQGSVVAVV